MEHNDFSDEFESFLQEKANEHKLYPSDKVWPAIQQKINRPKRWPFVALTLLFVGLGLITSIIEPANNQLALRSPELVQKLNATTLKNLSVSQIKNPISVSSNYLNKNNYSKFNHSSSLTTNINSISPSNEVDNNSLVSNPQEITIQEATIFDTTSKTSIDLSISALIVDENLTETNNQNIILKQNQKIEKLNKLLIEQSKKINEFVLQLCCTLLDSELPLPIVRRRARAPGL